MTTTETRRPLALVTGASAGLGDLFSRKLAAKGYDLVVCARRLDRLEALATDLPDVTLTPVAADLSTPEGVAACWAAVDDLPGPLRVVINNAGFGLAGTFEGLDGPRQLEMIDLNIRALVELGHGGIQRMRAHGERSYILNVGSVAGHQPIPNFAVYAATKSFVRDYSEAVARELSGSSISMTVLEPGGTRTEFMGVAGMVVKGAADSTMMDADTVVSAGLKAMFRGRARVVAGVSNKVIATTVKFTPRALAARVAGCVMGEIAQGGDT